MAEHTVHFEMAPDAVSRDAPAPVSVPTGMLVVEATRLAGIDLGQPCGGQGRCGRCAIRVTAGDVRRRSTLRLKTEDVAAGYALACQSVIESDVTITIPSQAVGIERRLTTDRTAIEVTAPAGYSPAAQTMRRIALTLKPPDTQDQTDDWSRLQTALRRQTGINAFGISLPLLRRIGGILRAQNWVVTAIIETDTWDHPTGSARLVDLIPGIIPDTAPLWGIAVDIGTTTVSLWLVDLVTGAVRAQVAEYNDQISRGEDVISRIIYSARKSPLPLPSLPLGEGWGEGLLELRELVLKTINSLLVTACKRVLADAASVVKATIAGNSTMMHLLLGIPCESIRLAPFVTAVNHTPVLPASAVGLHIHPEGSVDCLPGVASYVGADISAGVLSSGLDDAVPTMLFMDVGTNGEIVLGNHEFLATCACSAGPAFEGAGVQNGMRATEGAIEEVWVNSATYEPTFRVIGGGAPGARPRGLCGSGLIALLAELFLTGVIDRSGNFNLHLPTARVRSGEHGAEYVIVWATESQTGQDIVITHVDIDNLMRAKAAIYAGFTVLAEKVGMSLEMAEQVLIGGSFGKYINVEKAVEIGLLPDMAWDRFKFLGNTSVRGAYLALLDRAARARIRDIAGRMTYIELTADNSFYDAFISALFLPHTDLSRFPSVQAALALNSKDKPVPVKEI